MVRNEKLLVWVGRVSLSLVVALGLCLPQVAQAREYHLKIQSAYPRGDISMGALPIFAQSAEKRSNGQIKVKVYAEPEVVPGGQLFDAVKNRAVDMLQACGLYWNGIMPVDNVEVGPPMAFQFPGKSFQEQAKLVRDFYFKSGMIDLLRKEYAKRGLYLLDIHTYGPVPFVLARKPLKSLADFKGQKIRADGIDNEFHAGVGMHGAVIDGSEGYMALKLGTVDAAEWDLSAVSGMHWNEVAPYWIRGMENDQMIGHILINLDEWNSFPKEVQQALAGAGEDYWNATVNAYGKELQNIEALVKQGKLHEVWIDKDAHDAYWATAQKIWGELAKQDEASAQAIALVRKWRNLN